MLDKLYCWCLLLVCMVASSIASGPECSEPQVEGEGDGQELRFFYDSTAQACYPFFYKGVGGNSNNHKSDRECMSACAPNADTHYPEGALVCALKYDRGPCYGLLPKFYYSQEDQTCRVFHYGGCQGNGNRFDKREDCIELCRTKSGRSGGTPDTNPDATTVNAGLIVGVIGGVIFAVAVISALGLFITQRKSKGRSKVPTVDGEGVEMR
ncbi:inter-alpha-trypsin inhibitor [Engraulis encrasicolus]|uniref:inter-alpha-trypsin inhibitor n=1 Tax=Engraulis encrasicolus TaxID=184585 RepID=UPI002FD58DE6